MIQEKTLMVMVLRFRHEPNSFPSDYKLVLEPTEEDYVMLYADPEVEDRIVNKIRDEFLSIGEVDMIITKLDSFGYTIKLKGHMEGRNWDYLTPDYVIEVFKYLNPYLKDTEVRIDD